MASKQQVESFSEELMCPICLNFFTDPVSLDCGHNFCRRCITRCWEREERNSCPECREALVDRTLRVNRALANLAEKARKLQPNRKEEESKFHCEEHEEELKLFCETDKKLICVICATSREHKSHNFMPVKEAVEIYKAQVKSAITSLREKKSVIQEMEQEQRQKISRVREQSRSLKSYITSEFIRMHQMLTEKEQRLLSDLREEEGKVLNTMEKHLRDIQVNLNSMDLILSTLQKQLDQEDNVLFLREEASRKRRISEENPAMSVADGVLPVAKFDHPFLLNTVLCESFDAIKRVPVTMDVETANPGLEVSADLKGVRWNPTRKILPNNRKRFTYWSCVLGSEGFTSGRHYWEVEVRWNQGWRLGVAAESVERKRDIRLIPDTGFWTIERVDDVLHVNTFTRSALPADPIPKVVGIYLSYEFGTVSFYNADTKSHLHSFSGNKFEGKLYPFFWTWDANCLRICSGSAPDM